MPIQKLCSLYNIIAQGGIFKGYTEAKRYTCCCYPSQGIPYYYRIKSYLNWKLSGDYDYRTDPYKLLILDPENIIYISQNRFGYSKERFNFGGCIKGGNWDITKERFCENLVYKSFKMRFQKDINWELTPIYKNTIKIINAGESSWHNCSNEEDLKNRCQEMDSLYQSIKDNGYKRQEALLDEREDDLTNPALFRKILDEVCVNIGRNGEVLFVGGYHRLSIAKILGLKKIPVWVQVRHHQWQEKIDQINSNNKNGKHPDIMELYSHKENKKNNKFPIVYNK